MEKNYSKEIAERVKEFLISDDWKFSFDEEKGIFKYDLSIGGRIRFVEYVIDVMEKEYIVYTLSPVGGEADNKSLMSRIAEYICRINYGMKNGNFEFDMRDGELRFKTFVDCDGVLPTDNMVHNSIYCAAAMFEFYGDDILKVIFTDYPVCDEDFDDIVADGEESGMPDINLFETEGEE